MWQKHQDREWEKEKFEMDLKARELEMKAKLQETEMEIELASAQGAWRGLDTSIEHDKALVSSSGGFANTIKSIFRPFLTTLLVCVSAWVFYLIWQAFSQGKIDSIWLVLFTEAELKDIMKYMVYSLYFASTTSVVWWFGDRAFSPPGMKNR